MWKRIVHVQVNFMHEMCLMERMSCPILLKSSMMHFNIKVIDGGLNICEILKHLRSACRQHINNVLQFFIYCNSIMLMLLTLFHYFASTLLCVSMADEEGIVSFRKIWKSMKISTIKNLFLFKNITVIDWISSKEY